MATSHPITQNVITELNRSLMTLQGTLGSLGEEQVQRIRDDAQAYLQTQIQSVNAKMGQSEEAQNAQVEELKQLFKRVFEEELVKELKKLIEAEVLQEIDDLVKAEVAKNLPEYLPQELQAEMLRHEAELADLEKQLHNSESARANAQLSLGDLEAPLQPLYDAKGEIHPAFPKNLGELFSMTDENARTLLRDYRPEYQITDSRDKNVNEVMRLCGVRFQLVRRRSSS
ncbi:hypothetical protein PYCCODRAFT_1438946 [Trametes coccinea BRFM310]|uniref:Uncharacterized protein n=1 Tax=Trametes coccinea (strain BRFM310) TaxID=1353009 RepID=A0A1Y2ICF9_TRAC3|nr:hypothetical protein PYCCODRAFT_1438946 [Trametes coccinea BRFM310]